MKSCLWKGMQNLLFLTYQQGLNINYGVEKSHFSLSSWHIFIPALSYCLILYSLFFLTLLFKDSFESQSQRENYSPKQGFDNHLVQTFLYCQKAFPVFILPLPVFLASVKLLLQQSSQAKLSGTVFPGVSACSLACQAV